MIYQMESSTPLSNCMKGGDAEKDHDLLSVFRSMFHKCISSIQRMDGNRNHEPNSFSMIIRRNKSVSSNDSKVEKYYYFTK